MAREHELFLPSHVLRAPAASHRLGTSVHPEAGERRVVISGHAARTNLEPQIPVRRVPQLWIHASDFEKRLSRKNRRGNSDEILDKQALEKLL